jgi:uncharacterized membrane protein YcjF (UPF0283 family)
MRIFLGALLSLGTIAFSGDWFLLSYQGIEPQIWQVSVGLIIISLVLLKSSIEEIYLGAKARTEKKNEKKALIDLHERMSNETAKLYAKVKEEEIEIEMKEQKNTTSLGDFLMKETTEEVMQEEERAIREQ